MRSALKDVDVVIHLAAIVGASACDRDPGMATSVNLDSVKLLNRLRSPQQLVIYPNTNSGYGSTEGTSFCTEETPLVPISLYGRPSATRKATCSRAPTPSHCGWRPSSAWPPACGSICW